jgi:catechol 2,3-dioxygenase-like lactoylglutathione lyase family enzyme
VTSDSDNSEIDLAAIDADRERIRATYLKSEESRPDSMARGLHHFAISVEPEKWAELKTRLEEAGVKYQSESGASIYFRDPNGARLELISDPLGEMYGTKVL